MIIWTSFDDEAPPMDGTTLLFCDSFGAFCGHWDDEDEWDHAEYHPGWRYFEIGGDAEIDAEASSSPTHWARITIPKMSPP